VSQHLVPEPKAALQDSLVRTPSAVLYVRPIPSVWLMNAVDKECACLFVGKTQTVPVERFAQWEAAKLDAESILTAR
jgi:hypothetical protein